MIESLFIWKVTSIRRRKSSSHGKVLLANSNFLRLNFERLEFRDLFAAEPFFIAVLPDTQFYSQSYPGTFDAQTQWVLDNRISQNIAFVAQLGDIVQSGESGSTQNPVQ